MEATASGAPALTGGLCRAETVVSTRQTMSASPTSAVITQTVEDLNCPRKQRANLSAAMMGHEVSEETRAKLREARGRRITTDAARANMSAAQTGRKASEETRAKISAARKAYGARRRSA